LQFLRWGCFFDWLLLFFNCPMSRMNYRIVSLWISLLLIGSTPSMSRQVVAGGQAKESDAKSVEAVFSHIQDGINASDVAPFSQYFVKQISVSVSGNETGLYSATQAKLILREFLSLRKFTGFKFSTMNLHGTMRYATGGGLYMLHGTLYRFQIYVSLSSSGGRWNISQFNIY